MGYKYFIKKENGRIVNHNKIYVNDGDTYDVPTGFEELSNSHDPEFIEFQNKTGAYTPSESDQTKINNYKKIDLKVRIDTGVALGMDMSEEETEFNKL